MVNTPIPHSLRSEAKKAAKILKEFTFPTAKMGPDKLIPAGIFMKAKGLAILTVVKAGFLVTARAGSGIVIAKVDDGLNSGWSAPSAIGIAGLGGGFEIGAEVTDFVIVLNKRSAVNAFSKGGNLTLGGNFTIAAGPLGRNLEADVAVRGQAAIYTYSKTRGLFAGISVEGSGLIERKDANKKFYGRDIRAFEILRGDMERPEECSCLYDVLDTHKRRAEKELVRMAKQKALDYTEEGREEVKSKFDAFTSSFRSRKKTKGKSDEGDRGSADRYSDDSPESSPKFSKKPSPKPSVRSSPKSSKHVTSTKVSTKVVKTTSPSLTASRSPVKSVHKTTVSKSIRSRPASGASTWSVDSWELHATAARTYEAQLPCDLSFKRGDELVVLTRTDSQHDWWEGRLNGKTGIFPSNYVRLKK